MRETSICIIGLGPWGLCVLERIVSRAKRSFPPTNITVHVVEKGEPGVGVHYSTLPDYLLLNTKCGHVSMFVDNQFQDIEDPVRGPTLRDWAHQQGYRIAEDGYGLRLSQGREITPDDFLPRRSLAEYLHWFYENLLVNAPDNINIVVHECMAEDVEDCSDGQKRIILDTGDTIPADFVFLTTGHTPNSHAGKAETANSVNDTEIKVNYPLDDCLNRIKPTDHIALAGFGLVAIDVLTALTTGRGGRFVIDAEAKKRKYLPSGLEPKIFMVSRSGAPYCARPAISKDPSQFGYQAAFFTTQEVDRLRNRNQRQVGDTRLDLLRDVLPVLWDEMKLVYYQTAARITAGEEESDRIRAELIRAREEGRFGEAVNSLAKRYQFFDPENYVLNPIPGKFDDEIAYGAYFRTLIQNDLEEAYKGEIESATKAAFELFRVLRNVIRYAVDFGGLLPDSQILFSKRISSLINRVIVGPPKERLEELVALMDAGIVTAPFGPDPIITVNEEDGRVLVSSTLLDKENRAYLDKICYAHLGHPSVDRSLSPLISRLKSKGKVKPFTIDGIPIGGIHLDRNLHPVGTEGQSDQRIFVLGPLAEGIRYFNHYIPSPTSRILAFQDADQCIKQILTVAKVKSTPKVTANPDFFATPST